MSILVASWEGVPVTTAFSEKEHQVSGSAATLVRGALPAPVAEASSAHPVARAGRGLQEWGRRAEDLMAIFFLRWLAAALCQIWILLGFLVVGSLSLLMAVSSYPIPYQSQAIFGLKLLIALLAVVIGWIVVGLNRDELISRISNTTPNQLTLDGNLLSSLFTYVIPLLGILVVFSFDASDMIRALLDPILRQLR